RALLLRQHELTRRQALPATEPGAERTGLYQQLLELADLVLAGYTAQLAALRGTERHAAVQAEFEADRYHLIEPLLEAEQYERATSLAEKYADFRVLVEVCERTNSTERRNKYLAQFADQGFASFVFNWYLDQGRRGQLLSQCRQAELAGFLHDYRGLRWLNELEAGRFAQAGDTLAQCADAETEFLTRKKTYLSLSKLCALAGQQGDELEVRLTKLKPAIELSQLQEQLPSSVLEAHGIDAETMHVLSPRELILLYVSPENEGANEFDFERALELAESATLEGGDEEREQLRLEIWCRAVLRDLWTGLDTDRPLEACRDTLLLRTIRGLQRSGRRPLHLLPELNLLLDCKQLSKLRGDRDFAFLLGAVYEYVERLEAHVGEQA
ncbi:nuclear pore complex protein Nup133-like, partial [Pollicipes pollicipes]|uniref:nuclear pore complex protein Nup133-like n=1 Tax=Pollicipes pollicipes TaxID=41117 RepID=UPI0018853B60